MANNVYTVESPGNFSGQYEKEWVVHKASKSIDNTVGGNNTSGGSTSYALNTSTSLKEQFAFVSYAKSSAFLSTRSIDASKIRAQNTTFRNYDPNSVTAFRFKFNPLSQYAREKVATISGNEIRTKVNASKEVQIDFIYVVNRNTIDNLLNQLNLDQFKRKSKSQINKEMKDFLKDIHNELIASSQCNAKSRLQKDIPEDEKKINTLKSEIELLNKEIKNGGSEDFFSRSASQSKRIRQRDLKLEDLEELTNSNSIEIKIDFEKRLNAVCTKVVGDDDFEKAIRNKSSNFGKFATRFLLVVNAIKDRIPTDADVVDTNRTKNKSGVKDKAGAEADRPGLALDASSNSLGTQAGLVAASGQIIQIESSGSNTFGKHKPYDQIMSILDIMRDERVDVVISSDLNVPAELRDDSKVIGDDEATCKAILDKFSTTDLENMKKAMEEQKTFNNSLICNNLISLKRIQGQSDFKFMSAFSGFEGINFSKIGSNISDSAIAIGSSIADTATSTATSVISTATSAISNVTGTLGSISNGVEDGIKAVREINVKDMGSAFGRAVSDITQQVAPGASQLFALAASNQSKVNFKKVLDGVSEADLKKCPSIAKMKKIMENPDDISTDKISSLRNKTEEVAKNYKGKIDETEAINIQNSNLDKNVSILDEVIAQKTG